MIAGFTGTRHGMSTQQFTQLRKHLQDMEITKLHHGCCVGGDYQANYIARRLGIPTVGHPPLDTKHQADCIIDEMRKRFPYLRRNYNIVVEVLRSGTWATYRYAVKCGVAIVLLKR